MVYYEKICVFHVPTRAMPEFIHGFLLIVFLKYLSLDYRFVTDQYGKYRNAIKNRRQFDDDCRSLLSVHSDRVRHCARSRLLLSQTQLSLNSL